MTLAAPAPNPAERLNDLRGALEAAANGEGPPPQARVSLAEASELFDISETTLRKYARDPSFPVLSRGSHGVPYELDPFAVKGWLEKRSDDLERATHERAEELAQMRLELFGGDTSPEESERLKLSGRQRKEEAAAELELIKLRRVKGELLERSAVEHCQAVAYTELRNELMAVADSVARLLSLDRSARNVIDEAIRSALERAVETLADPESYVDEL
jgi:hypothetical protein